MTKRTLILTTPRTGSNALCEGMTSLGVWGRVEGFAIGHGAGLAGKFEENSVSYEEKHRNTLTGGFATKVMWDYINHLAQHCGIDPVIEWLHGFDYYVHLYREDVRKQAVSWFFALAEGKWTSYNTRKKDPPTYNRHKIEWFEAQIISENARTDAFMTLIEHDCILSRYEHNIKDWTLAVYVVAMQTGFDNLTIDDVRDTVSVTKHQRQTDTLKSNYVKRYINGE